MHAVSIYIGLALYAFYYLGNYALQYIFYYGTRPAADGSFTSVQLAQIENWKVRPDLTMPLHARAEIPFSPLFRCCRRSERPWRVEHPWAWLFEAVNPAMSAVFCAAVVEAIVTSHTRMYFTCPVPTAAVALPSLAPLNSSSMGTVIVTRALQSLPATLTPALPATDCHVGLSLLATALELLLLYLYENVTEYYWHRTMHLPFFYRHFHKVHHFNKSPIPFDDMLIHPVEAAGYYTILFAPPFLFTHHVGTFIAYMSIMGVAGILDHSGVRVHVPGLYASGDHDTHHRLFDVNYGFPHPVMDLLHGTFHGSFTCCGRTRVYAVKQVQKPASVAKKSL